MGIDFWDTLPGTAFDLLIRATILLATAAIVVLFLRRASAAFRHLVWTLALAAVLVQPLLSRVSVPWSISVPLPITAGSIAPPQPRAVPPTAAPAVPAGQPAATVTTTSRVPPWTIIGLCVWLGRTLFVLSQLHLGMRRVRRIYRQSVAPAGELAATVEGVLSGLPLPRKASVRVAPKESPTYAPLTWGWHRPIVLLPAAAGDWPAEQVRAALLHEAGHIRRADWLVQRGIFLTCALYWWHPLVWWAARRAREESERACDDFVLNAGMPPADYAAHLVAVVRAIRGEANHHGASVAMAQSSGMERRIRAALSERVDRRPVTRRYLAISAVFALVLLGGFVCLRPVMGGMAPLASRNPIAFYYLPMVECPADGSRPLQIDPVGRSRAGVAAYQFRDKRTGKTFRDGAPVVAEFAQLALQGKTPRTGASAYAVPAEFRQATTQTRVYLTASQRKEAESLRGEMRAWRALLAASPRILTAADLEPKAVAKQSVTGEGFSVQISLTPGGSNKLREFTGKHVKEILGVVIDPEQPGSHLQMAPTIMEAVSSPTLEIAPFKTLAEAEKFASHLNTR